MTGRPDPNPNGNQTMTSLATILDTGLNWLYDTVQPDDSHQQHHGIVLHLPEANRWYGFCPDGAQHLPVVSVDVLKPEWIDNGFNRPSTLANPLGADELPALAEELRRRGFESFGTWNGHPGPTGSVGLTRKPHPTLVAAVDRYHRGCTVHPERRVFCDCDAWNAGFTLIVRPQPAARSR